jgi:hypothetical protein
MLVWQVFLQVAHHGGIRLSPARSKTPAGLLRCNGDEKRETGWEQFLASKCGDDHAAYVIRHSKITEWHKQCGTPRAYDPEVFTQVQSSVEACNKLLDGECKRIRLLLALPPTKSTRNKKPEKTRRLDCGQSLRRRQTP